MDRIAALQTWEFMSLNGAAVGALRPPMCLAPPMSDLVWKWCAGEIRDNATRFIGQGLITIFDMALCVVKSDMLVHGNLWGGLRFALEELATAELGLSCETPVSVSKIESIDPF
jgi:hypothetical protein